MNTLPVFSIRHSEDGLRPRNLSSIAKAREIPRFARNDEVYVAGLKNVGAPTIQVELEVGDCGVKEGREIPRYVRGGEFLLEVAKNVGAPTFKVTLEVRLDITDSQIGVAPEVIA